MTIDTSTAAFEKFLSCQYGLTMSSIDSRVRALLIEHDKLCKSNAELIEAFRVTSIGLCAEIEKLESERGKLIDARDAEIARLLVDLYARFRQTITRVL